MWSSKNLKSLEYEISLCLGKLILMCIENVFVEYVVTDHKGETLVLENYAGKYKNRLYATSPEMQSR